MSVTLLELRTRARIRADQDASTFPTDAQYNYLINESVKDVWGDLLGAGMPWTSTVTSVTLSGGFNGFNATTPVAAIRGVFASKNGRFYELRRLPEDQRAGLIGVYGDAVYYDFQHNFSTMTIQAYPIPTDGTVLRVEVVFEHPSLTSDVSFIDLPPRGDELVVLRSAMKAMRKEGNDQGASQVAQEYEELWERAVRMATWVHRDAAVIRDVRPMDSVRDPFDYDV